MLKRLKELHHKQRGLTLIEVIVVVAILGILAAILIPSVSGLIGEGEETRLDADAQSVNLAVTQFLRDRRQGPDAGEWGAAPGAKRRYYPTADGEVGDIEIDLATDQTDAGNLPIVKWVDGPNTGGDADATDIENSLVWMGLLVNEPNDTNTSAQQSATGDAAPLDDEEGEYLSVFPESAHPDNTERAAGGSYTDGSYYYVVLHNGNAVAVYQASDGLYYAGYGEVYP